MAASVHIWTIVLTVSLDKSTKQYFFITWVKEDNSLECCIFVLVYLNILKGLDQLIKHSVGYLKYLLFRTVPVDHTAITCTHITYRNYHN